MNYRILAFFLIFITITSFAFAILPSGEIKIFAVTTDEKGMAADLHLYAIPGEGQVAFITSNSLVGKDTQTTGNIALEIARKKTNVNISSQNFIYDIKANASEVDGPSAGAAMTLLAYSLLSEKPLNTKVGITGTINSDGSVGAVGGVGAKAEVASELGLDLFMIPVGQSVAYVNNTAVNLLEYAPKNWDLTVIEVANIDDVLKYAYSDPAQIKVDSSKIPSTFIPTSIKYKTELEPMVKISQEYIDRAKNAIDEAEKELELTDLDDATRVSFYNQLGDAKRNVELSQIYLDQNYLYSAANYSFNAHVVASTIATIASSPSLLSGNSKIFELKISDLEKEIKSLKEKMVFIPIDKFEWIIGAQQRIAYAENALEKVNEVVEFETSDEELIIQIGKVREYVSALEWIEVAKDFFIEAKANSDLRKVEYSSDFIYSVSGKISAIEKLMNDVNLTSETEFEALRRLNSAKISQENGFYYAALYDIYFAQAFINSEVKRSSLSAEEIEMEVYEMEKNQIFSSLWANLFFDHSKFFIENSRFEKELQRTNMRESMLKTAYDLLILSEKIEEVKLIVANELSKQTLEKYVLTETDQDGSPQVQIEYIQKSPLLNYFAILSILLLVVLAFLVVVGFKSKKVALSRDITRAEKIDSLLNRLDKALSKKKINDAEYFFLKKKYDNESRSVDKLRAKKSKITLNLDESKAKLRALQRGLKDLKKHYKSGLIIPDDYEKHLKEVNSEIVQIKLGIKKYESELHSSRRVSKRVERKADSEFNVEGTGEKEKKVTIKDAEEREKRRKLLTNFWGNKK